MYLYKLELITVKSNLPPTKRQLERVGEGKTQIFYIDFDNRDVFRLDENGRTIAVKDYAEAFQRWSNAVKNYNETKNEESEEWLT
jgi:23S rRNA pseudoU1915 N3-methylase RlmH